MRKDRAEINFNIIAYCVITLLTAACILPFLTIISGSLTDNNVIIFQGYHILPRQFSTSAYETLFRYPKEIINAYSVTILVTVVGTFFGTIFICMTAYVLAHKDFKYRDTVSFIIYFTTIFGGGLVPWYMVYTGLLGLRDNLLAMIIPSLMSPFLIILMRTFIKFTVPESLYESAKLDGANDFRTFWQIILPIVTPALATIALFLALHYWNDWYLSSLFITTQKKQSLQYYLYNMLNGARTLKTLIGANGVSTGNMELPSESAKLAMAVIASGPVFLFYPFAQKYFIAGITVGSVKG